MTGCEINKMVEAGLVEKLLRRIRKIVKLANHHPFCILRAHN